MSTTKVVVVSAYKDIRELIEEMIEVINSSNLNYNSPEKYEVVGLFDNTKEALEVVWLKEPDLVITDVDVSGLNDGVEFSKIVHKINYGTTSVVLMSGRPEEELAELGKKVGAISVMQRPYSFSLEKLEQILKCCSKSKTKLAKATTL
jgi:two-component system CitB family response regulator/CitB family two-component system response regulator CitT